MKLAVSVAELESVHGLVVPVQLPLVALFAGVLHPPKPKDAVGAVTGVAVNVTCDTPLNVAVQVGGQLIPAGLLVTVPSPAPPSSMVRSFTPRVRPWHAKSANIPTIAVRAATNRQIIRGILFNLESLDEAGAELVGNGSLQALAYTGKYGDSGPFEAPDNWDGWCYPVSESS